MQHILIRYFASNVVVRILKFGQDGIFSGLIIRSRDMSTFRTSVQVFCLTKIETDWTVK